jgi:hypothetical protein
MQKTITGSYTLLSADNDYTIIVNNGAEYNNNSTNTLVSKFNAGFIQVVQACIWYQEHQLVLKLKGLIIMRILKSGYN